MKARSGQLLQIVRLGRCKQLATDASIQLTEGDAHSLIHERCAVHAKNTYTAKPTLAQRSKCPDWTQALKTMTLTTLATFFVGTCSVSRSPATWKLIVPAICLLVHSIFSTLPGILTNQVTRFEGHMHDPESHLSPASTDASIMFPSNNQVGFVSRPK